MQITPSGTHRSATGPDDRFTGTVRVSPLFAAEPPSQVAGARTNWHTHPLGQTLIVTFGGGWVQREGEPIAEIRAGDVVRFAADERHWHGASADNAMSHIAIQESVNGSAVTWLEPVRDADYRR